MNNCTTTYTNKCLIATSSLSLGCYPCQSLSLTSSSTLLYSCFDEKCAAGIPIVDAYEIILDFDNPEIEGIIFTLFNKLLSVTTDISVIATRCTSPWDTATASKLASLKKLRDHGFIRLEIVGDPEAECIDFSANSIENVTCFIGPGNTGKTSILSSISEVFSENKRSIALLDLTQTHKLVGYFTDSIDISAVLNSFTEYGQWDIPYRYICCNEFVSLYHFDSTVDKPYAAPILLYKFVEHLSKVYDHVVINAGYQALDNFQRFFSCIDKIFIVYDLTPTKIGLSYQLLMKLYSLGLTTKPNTSIIYNKVEKSATDIQFFEENVIFDKSAEDRLTPLIDVQCNTFEIWYSKRTMAALLQKFKSRKQTLGTASKNYIKNIRNIYKLMNNIQYHEGYDIQFNELIRCYTGKLKSYIPVNLLKRAIRIFSKRKSELLNDYTHSA